MTKKPGGIGMGLTVAPEVVALYACRMTAESQDPHSGAMIVFDLPLAPNQQNQGGHSDDQGSDHRRSRGVDP